jgi:hypothetical protein
MSLHPKTSYFRILSRIATHWKEVDSTLLMGTPLVLHGSSISGLTLNRLIEHLLSIRSQLSVVQQCVENSTEARLIADSAKRAILFRAQALARNIHWKSNNGSPNRITYPRISDECEIFLSSLEEMAAAWFAVNRLPGGPMTLTGHYSHSDFVVELANLVESIAISRKAHATEHAAREKYDALFESTPEVLNLYHRNVIALLPQGSPLLRNLPVLSVPQESVPPPTACSGVWLESENSAFINWQHSTDPRSHHHEIRYSPGDNYDEDVESTLAVIPMGQLPSWKGTSLISPVGFISLFRVYVVLKSGAESHGGTISIVRANGDD